MVWPAAVPSFRPMLIPSAPDCKRDALTSRTKSQRFDCLSMGKSYRLRTWDRGTTSVCPAVSGKASWSAMAVSFDRIARCSSTSQKGHCASVGTCALQLVNCEVTIINLATADPDPATSCPRIGTEELLGAHLNEAITLSAKQLHHAMAAGSNTPISAIAKFRT